MTAESSTTRALHAPARPTQPTRRLIRGSLAATLGMVGWTASAAADPTLDELLNLTPPVERPTPAETSQVPVDPDVARRLTGEQAADALEQAIAEMQTVSDRLGRELDPGLATQRHQEAILAKLDQVIAAARQMQQQGSPSGSSGGSAGQPQGQQSGSAANAGSPSGQQGAQNGSSSAQEGGQGDQAGERGGGPPQSPNGSPTAPLEETRSEWGNLPPRLRDQLLEGTREKFSPVYRGLTEAYYKRLAEEGR